MDYTLITQNQRCGLSRFIKLQPHSLVSILHLRAEFAILQPYSQEALNFCYLKWNICTRDGRPLVLLEALCAATIWNARDWLCNPKKPSGVSNQYHGRRAPCHHIQRQTGFQDGGQCWGLLLSSDDYKSTVKILRKVSWLSSSI